RTGWPRWRNRCGKRAYGRFSRPYARRVLRLALADAKHNTRREPEVVLSSAAEAAHQIVELAEAHRNRGRKRHVHASAERRRKGIVRRSGSAKAGAGVHDSKQAVHEGPRPAAVNGQRRAEQEGVALQADAGDVLVGAADSAGEAKVGLDVTGHGRVPAVEVVAGHAAAGIDAGVLISTEDLTLGRVLGHAYRADTQDKHRHCRF